MNDRNSRQEKPLIHASRLGQCCVCEKQVLLDIKYGVRRTPEQMEQVENGIRTHAKMNRRAQIAYDGVDTSVTDKHCFIASYCLGIDSIETKALHRYRDQVLRQSQTGRLFIAAYYRWSPFIVDILERCDGLRRCTAIFLKQIVSVIDKRRHWQ